MPRSEERTYRDFLQEETVAGSGNVKNAMKVPTVLLGRIVQEVCAINLRHRRKLRDDE